MLFTSKANAMKYDIIMLPCEGTAVYSKSNGGPGRGILVDYLKDGGRVFATHYSYNWLTYTGSPFNAISKPKNNPPMDGLWPVDQNHPNMYDGTLDVSFPKGMAFRDWLKNVQTASQPLTAVPPDTYSFSITDPRIDLDEIDHDLAQRWIYNDNGTVATTQHMTFNTPLDAPVNDMGSRDYCGRVVFSDFHVSANAVSTKGGAFPTVCNNDPLTTQEKALIFMLFDLSSCVQADQAVPIT
jgi:hypothetical protein